MVSHDRVKPQKCALFAIKSAGLYDHGCRHEAARATFVRIEKYLPLTLCSLVRSEHEFSPCIESYRSAFPHSSSVSNGSLCTVLL